MRRAVAQLALKPTARRTLLPWLSLDSLQREVTSARYDVATMKDGGTEADLSSSLVSKMFADNDHLAHVRLDDMASIPPQYVYARREKVSRRLIEKLPVNSETAAVWWTCTGSEALSTAIWAMTHATGRPGVFTMDRSYHGSGVHNAQFGTDPRNMIKRTDHVKVQRSPTLPRPIVAADVAEALDTSDLLFQLNPHAKTLVIEGSSGSAHGAPWPDGYVEALVTLARDKHGVMVILDEVMSGLQRCGSGLYAAAARGTSPGFEVDAVCEGKALTNGALPVAVAVINDATDYEADPWQHGSTFSGYKAGVDATDATLDRLELAGSDIDALEAHIKEWNEDAATIPFVADIRGQGLLWTIELDLPFYRVAEFKRWLAWKRWVRIFGQENRLLLAPSVGGIHTIDSLEKLAFGLRSFF